MEDLYTASAEKFDRELIPRSAHHRPMHSTTDITTTSTRNLPNIVTDMHKMRFDACVSNENKEVEARDQEIAKMKLELERCSEQVYQVMRMNTNWQRYNDQRESKDQERDRERTIMIRQIKMLKEHVALSEQKIIDMKSVYRTTSDVSTLKAEINELRKHLEIKEAEIQNLKVESGPNHSEEDKTMIEFLRQQVNVYVEDFRKEREDREAIQAKYDTTRIELLEAQKAIERLKMLNRKEDVTYPYGNWEKQIRPFDVGMRARGVEYQRQPTDRYNASGLSDEVEVDCDNSDDDDSLLNTKKEGNLQCPACFKSFSFKDHHLLVEHMDECS